MASGPAWGVLEEVVAHDSDKGQKNSELLEVHLLVAVLVQVTHQLLQALFIHLLLEARENRVTTRLTPPNTHWPEPSSPSALGSLVSGRQGAPRSCWEHPLGERCPSVRSPTLPVEVRST